MSTIARYRTSALTACGIFSVAASLAHAQDAATAQGEETLGEVVVRSEPLNKTHQVNVGAFGERDVMDIPISIQNYSAADFESKVARTLLDVLKNDPSVAPASVGGSYDYFRMRGFAIDWTNTLRRDGLSLAPYQDVALENIERIDALKGPSGFLYGFNSPGGSINYIVKRPTATPFWTVNAHLSDLDGRYVGLDTSHSSASGLFGVRLNGAYEKVGDFDHAADLERSFISAAMDFRLSDRVVLQLNADYQDSAKIADPLLRADQGPRGAPPLDPATYIEPPRVDRRVLLSPGWFHYQHRGANYDAKLDMRLSDDWFAVVQANSSQNIRDSAFQDIFDIAPNGDIGDGGSFISPGENLKVVSGQAFIGGKFTTGAIGHDIFTGVSQKRFTGRYNDAAFLSTSVGNVLDPVQPDEVAIPDLPYVGKDVVREKSVFFSDLVTLTERWQALLGIRYIDYESKFVEADGVAGQAYTQSDYVPSFGLIFKPRPNVTTYASFSRGLEQGEYPPFFADNYLEQTAPIESKQVEVGVKAEINRASDIGVAVFDIEKQAGYVNSDNLFVLDGTQRHRGIEVVANGRVANFRLAASLAYLDTELLDVLDPDQPELNGNRTEGTPEWTGALSVDYSVPAVKGLSFGSALSYASDRAVDAQNSGFIDGYTIVDANVQYATRLGSRPTRMRLNVKNLFDSYYYSSAYFGGLNVGRPREVVFSVSMDF